MWTYLMILGLSFVGGTLANFTLDAESALKIWFHDENARRAFKEIWDTEGYPLSAFADTVRVTSECQAAIRHLGDSIGLATLSMLDSSVKFPEGLFMLSFVHFGNWEECVGVRDVESSMGRFHGQMCMVKFSPTLDTGSVTQEELPTSRTALMSMLSTLSLKLGQCVPSTCTADDVQLIYQSITSQLPLVQGIHLSASVEEIDCTTQDRPSLDTSDWVAVGILIALGAIVVASTTYDLFMEENEKNRILVAFSVVANGKKLLAMPSNKGDQTLSCVHGLRFLSMCWVILAHSYMMTSQMPVINLTGAASFLSDWYRIGVSNATLSVDTFFTLGGLLAGYLFFRQAPEKRKLNIPLYYIHRYIRLTPPFAMMILLTATLSYRMGWGPIWQSTLKLEYENCRDEWWDSLLYISNYVNPLKQCLTQSWYLMIDMQLHWVSPIFLLPLVARPKIGCILLGSFCVAGVIENFVLSYVADMGASLTALSDAKKQEFYSVYYYRATYGRFVPYLEGLALGYFLGNRKYLQQESKKLSILHGTCAWLFVAACLLVPLGTGYEFLEDPQPSRTSTAFYNSLHRPAWGLGIIGVVYLCATRNGGPVNILLSWGGFQVLGRFSYCMYLVHITLMYFRWANMKTPSYFSDGVILPQFAADLLMSLIFAGILSVLCESPFIVLEKELLGKRLTKSPKIAPVQETTPPTDIESSMSTKTEKQ